METNQNKLMKIGMQPSPRKNLEVKQNPKLSAELCPILLII